MRTNFLDNAANQNTCQFITSLLAMYLLGEDQKSKLKLRYADMQRNFDCFCFDEWDGDSVDNVWKFSSGVTPYKDFDDTANIPIPITNAAIKKISDSAVTSLDLPTWFNLSNCDKRVVILAQDPMPRSKWYDDCRDAVCSSPFGLHTKTWREKGNGGGRIWGLVKNLMQNNIGVYLTDIRKFYFRTADAERKYIAPTNEINEIYRSLLSEELEIIKPTVIVTLGNQSASALTDLMNDEVEAQVINLPHFSGQAQGAIKEFFNVPQEHKFRIEEQIEYYSQFIINNVN
jgi:hypothetical protein